MKFQWSAVLISVMFTSMAYAQNADTMDTQTALAILLGESNENSKENSKETSKEAISPKVSKPIAPLPGMTAQYPDRVIVQRGDTLDTVIRRSMPASPFQLGFLRAAFMRFNPDVFGNSGPHRLAAGVSLHVPSQMELVSLILGSTQAASASRASESGGQPSERKEDPLMAQQQLHQDRKNWVRYP